jgi:GNAT superfamily N-acetyltransferase
MLTETRNEIKDSGWILKKVTDYLLLKKFSCGNTKDEEDLNEFFQKDVFKHKQELLSETYALREATVGVDCPPVALISLCNDSVAKDKIIGKLDGLKGTKKEYPFYPAVKIARFGVVKELQSKGIGSHAINMIKKLFVINNRTGCRLITLDAYNNERALKFYIKNDFYFLHDKDKSRDQRVMFYDLKRFV